MMPALVAPMMPATGDFEAIGAYRFQRKATAIGKRIESTAYFGLTLPGPQQPPGMMGTLRRAPGLYSAVSTGMASRSHYLWVGVGNLHYTERGGDQRGNVFNYSAVWGYRPPSWQKEYPRWDWRGFVELTRDRASLMHRAGQFMPGTNGHEVFFGPSILGIYKQYAIQCGVQWPVFRESAPHFNARALGLQLTSVASFEGCYERTNFVSYGRSGRISLSRRGRVAPDRSNDLRHGLSDLCPRRERGNEKTARRRIGRGQP